MTTTNWKLNSALILKILILLATVLYNSINNNFAIATLMDMMLI